MLAQWRSGIRQCLCLSLGAALLLTLGTWSAAGQALPTATGPGPRLMVGGTFADFQADYGQRSLRGGTVYLDAGFVERVSFEAEVRSLTINQEAGTHQSTFLIGPRLPFHTRRATPYLKLLAGEGRFHFPYNYADGNYLVLAPGGGLDVPIGNSRFSVRLIDFEYQAWVNFPFGVLHPYGIGSGISMKFF